MLTLGSYVRGQLRSYVRWWISSSKQARAPHHADGRDCGLPHPRLYARPSARIYVSPYVRVAVLIWARTHDNLLL
jgi:hypothetical protein